MRITIQTPLPGEEEEIIIKCASLSQDMLDLLASLGQKDGSARIRNVQKLSVYLDGKIHLIAPSEVFYFETVDQKVFAYCESNVYEIKKRLYELEELLPKTDFIRVSKASILNIDKISSLAPMLGGRFEARLKNGEKIIISRQYVNVLKETLGL